MNEVVTVEAKVLDTTHYSIGFPDESWDKLIDRENYISQMEGYLSDEIKILFIEGDEDIGKTTLSALFAKKHAINTITVFFNPLNTLDYKVEFFYSNVVNQIRFLLNEQAPDNEGYIGFQEYQQSEFKLRKMLKKGDKKINLIVDGLENKVKTDPEFVKKIMEIVPFGQDIFRIIISGNKNDFIPILHRKVKSEESKQIGLSGFSKTDITAYLELPSVPNEIHELYKITMGFPGRLRTLKRLIKSENYSLEKITSSTTYSTWVELDCESVDIKVPANSGILSLLSLSDNVFQINDISKMFSLTFEEAENKIGEFKILEISNYNVKFVSSAHKKYFATLLRGNKRKIQDTLIDYYANQNSINSLMELPKLYTEKKEWEKIIELIDDSYIERVLEGTGTIETVNERLVLGLQASEKMDKYVDMWRYSLQGSLINEIDNYLFWESEVNARISINDFPGAISLAESAVLKVDRLKLLALIARKQKEISKNVDEDLVKVIQEIYEAIDLSSVGNKIYDIVADLIYAIPNLAIEMIEKSTGSISEKSINDWIVAKLAIAAIDSNIKEEKDETKQKKIEAINTLNNPEVKKINQAVSFLVENYSSEKVLEEVRKLTDSKEKLRLLRLWLSNIRSDKNAESVINAALDELILSSSQTSITLDILKELSYQLPFIKNREAKMKLYKRFKSIEPELKDLGLTKNRYIYELNIFHTEFTLGRKPSGIANDTLKAEFASWRNKSLNTINRTIQEVEGINDTLVKLESFAEVYAKLRKLKHEAFRQKESFAYSRIMTLSEELYKSTASHFKISENLMKTIGKINPILALKICGRINTLARRERTKFLILGSYLDNNLKYVDISILKLIETSINADLDKQSLHIRVLERFAEAKSLHFDIIKSLLHFIDKVPKMQEPAQRLYGSVLAYKIIAKNADWKSRLSSQSEKAIRMNWKSIDADWERIDSGFTVCSDISRINEGFAKEIFLECEKLKNESWLDSRPVAHTFINSIKLIIRAYKGLLVSKSADSKDFKIIEDLINRLPSQLEKLNLWSEIGINAYLEEREDIAKRILNDHIIPLIQGQIDKKLDVESAAYSLIIVHIFNPELALDYINKAVLNSKEEIYSVLCHFYVTKGSPFEVYESGGENYNTNYSDLEKAITLLNHIKNDDTIYFQIDNVCKAISANKHTLSNPQIATLIQKLNQIVEKNLPDITNIRHDGYKIISRLKVAKITRTDIDNKTYWLRLISDASSIPNLSDKIFVNSILVDEIPFEKVPSGDSVKKKLYDEMIKELQSFTIHYEFVQRVLDISDKMYKVHRSAWKKIVNQAFSLSNQLENSPDVYASQRSIIDSMYRLDPQYAKELIKSLDQENRENKINMLLKKHYEALEVSTKIKNDKALDQKEKESYKMIVYGILQAERALNSEKIESKKISEVSTYLPIGNHLPLHEGFPVFMFYLNNCNRTYKTPNTQGPIADIHRRNFEVVVQATNMIEILSRKRKFSEKIQKKFFIDEDFVSNEALKHGSREEALNFIKSWLHDEGKEFIIVADAYLKKEDIEILKLIKEECKGIEIDFLGSENGNKENIEAEYKAYWKKISDEVPPFSNVTFCWIPEHNNMAPFHDRWIITKNSGLRLGTSISSLGINRDSEISIMKPNEALKIKENNLVEYITKRKKAINNQRISYKSFSL